MLQTLKFKGDDGDFWFVSDAHENQSCDKWELPLWHTRGFRSAKEHFYGFIDIWNNTIDNSKKIFNVGDFVFQDPKGEKFLELIGKLNYKEMYCSLGNHNSGQSPIYKRELQLQFPEVFNAGAEVYPLKYRVSNDKTVIFIPHHFNLKINGTLLVVNHFPIVSHENMAKGSILIAAHSHGNCELTSKDKGRGKRIDVGFDVWKRPISLVEIKEFLKNREIDSPDHH